MRLSRDLAEDLVAQDSSQAHWRLALARAQLAIAEERLARDDFESAGGLVPAARSLLEASLEADPADRAARRWLADSFFVAGRVFAGLGKTIQAGEAFDSALATLTPLARDSRDPELLAHYLRMLKFHNRDSEDAARVAQALRDLRRGAR